MPCASVTAERSPSMSAGLAASTVTPGSTPPDPSRTTPVMLLCAHDADGTARQSATITARIRVLSASFRFQLLPDRIRPIADVISDLHDFGRRADHFQHVEVRRREGLRHLVARCPPPRVGLRVV